MNQNEFDAFAALLSTIADYYGKTLKPDTISLYWNALAAYPYELVKRLANDHIKTSRWMPSIAELLDQVRAMDGRPNAEEAWATVARSLSDEGLTIVWTEEMAHAFGVALQLSEDRIAARMAFKEAYEYEVKHARSIGRPVKWTASLGHDPHGREAPLLEAAEKGRLAVSYIAKLLPYRDAPDPRVQKLIAASQQKQITA